VTLALIHWSSWTHEFKISSRLNVYLFLILGCNQYNERLSIGGDFYVAVGQGQCGLPEGLEDVPAAADQRAQLGAHGAEGELDLPPGRRVEAPRRLETAVLQRSTRGSHESRATVLIILGSTLCSLNFQQTKTSQTFQM